MAQVRWSEVVHIQTVAPSLLRGRGIEGDPHPDHSQDLQATCSPSQDLQFSGDLLQELWALYLPLVLFHRDLFLPGVSLQDPSILQIWLMDLSEKTVLGPVNRTTESLVLVSEERPLKLIQGWAAHPL